MGYGSSAADASQIGAPVLGAVAGGLLGGPAGAVVGASLGSAAGKFISGKWGGEAEQLKKDEARLRRGKFGMSEAEKRTMLAGAARGLQAQTAGMEANLRRQAAAQGGFGRSGAQQRALGNIVASQGEQLAQQAGRIDALSLQKAEQRRRELVDRIERRRAGQAAKFESAGQDVVSGVGATASALGQEAQRQHEKELAQIGADAEMARYGVQTAPATAGGKK